MMYLHRIPLLAGFLLFVFSVFSLPAQAQPAWAELVKRFDQNKDDKLQASELPPFLQGYMTRIDSNKDGSVTRDEVEATSNMVERQQQAQSRKRPDIRPPDGVTLRQDVFYREGNPKWTVDLFLPTAKAPEGGRPGLVVVHGGGWRGGDKRGGSWSAIPAEYAQNGYVAISVNYRLHPEVGMFDCIADVKCAVRWLRANAKAFGLDPERIGAYGNSAGAHLVSMLGLTNGDDKLEGDGPHEAFSSQVQAVCASATPADFNRWAGKPLTAFKPLTDHVPTAMNQLSAEQRAKAASPIAHVSSDAPPFLLVHAENDRVVPFGQGQRLAEQLKKAGAEVTLLSYKDGGHGVFAAKSKVVRPAMQAFFDRVLKP